MGNVNTIDKQHVHDLEEFTKWTLQNVEAAYAKFVKAKADKGFTGDLVMSRREFWETFTDYATVVNGEFLSLPVEMYNLFDNKGKGKVYALEIFVVLGMHCCSNIRNKLQFCFQLFDFDGSGTISQTEMVMLCRCLSRGLFAIGVIDNLHEYQHLEKVATETFNEADTDHNNEVSESEFTQWAISSLHTKSFVTKFSRHPEEHLNEAKAKGDHKEGVKIHGEKRSLHGAKPKKIYDESSLKKREHKINKNADHILKMKRRRMINKVASKQVLRSLVAETGLRLSELRGLSSEFGKFAWDTKGVLKHDDFLRVLSHKYPELKQNPELTDRLFIVFDEDKSGSISFKEFCLGVGKLLNGTVEEKLTLLFDMNDTDGNGQMDVSEILNAIKNADESFRAQAQFAAHVLHSLDLNHDGDVSRVEFQNVLKNDFTLMEAFSRTMPKKMEDALLMLTMEEPGNKLNFKGLVEFWAHQKTDPKWHHQEDHRLTIQQFREIMRNDLNCGEKTVTYCEKVFNKLNTRESENETVEIRVLMNGLCHIVPAKDDEKAGFYFDLYDYDNSGHIDPGELLKMILEAHEASTQDTKKLIEIVRTMDESKDGTLDKTEFIEAIKSNPEMLELFGNIFSVTHSTFNPNATAEVRSTEAGPNLKQVRAEYAKLTKGIKKI